MKARKTGLQLALATALTAAGLPAFAAGTAAGTDINNTAAVDFSVGGVAQTTVNSNTLSFKVDRRINVTVAEVGGAATVVVPGATGQVLTFTVTNTSNATQDFRLQATQDAGGNTAFGQTDNFDATAPLVFVDVNNNGVYDPATDNVSFIDELPADATRTVFVVASIPANRVNGDAAGVTLTAIAAQSTDGTGSYVATPAVLAGDAAETNTAAVDDPTYVDTVFGDAAGDTDAQYDGRHSDDDAYNVITAAIVVLKSSTVVSDPLNGISFPKAIPGAVVEYCLDIYNSGAAVADSILLTDAIPANTSYVAGSIKVGATATGATPPTGCDLGSGTAVTDAVDIDAGQMSANTVSVTAASIAAGARLKAVFRVTVN